MTEVRTFQTLLKHSMSCLSDQPVDGTIDDSRREVRLVFREFD